MLQVAVCGDSAIAHSVAAICGWKGHAVRLLTRSQDRWRDRLTGRSPTGEKFVAPLLLVTDDPAEALGGVDVAFVCVPHAAINAELASITPHVTEGMLVGGIPGFGGFGLLARRLREKGCVVFGTQRIPFVVRGCDYAKQVHIGAVRRQTFVGTLPAGSARPVAEFVGDLLGIRTVPVSHYLNIELSPSNSIVNPARLYSLFGLRAEGRQRSGHEFFKHWSLEASRTLLALDRELQNGRMTLPRDTSFVAPILLQYDANDEATLTDRFKGLAALYGRPIHLRQSDTGQLELDPHSHYLLEDVDIGLAIVRDILALGQAPTPLMDQILAWGDEIMANAGLQHAVRASPARFPSIESLAASLD